MELSFTLYTIKPATLAAITTAVVALLAVICTYKANDISERTLEFLRTQWLYAPPPQLVVKLVDKEKNGGLVLRIINNGSGDIKPKMLLLYLETDQDIQQVRGKEHFFDKQKGDTTFDPIGSDDCGEFFFTNKGLVDALIKKVKLLREDDSDVLIQGAIQLDSERVFLSANSIKDSELKSMKIE